MDIRVQGEERGHVTAVLRGSYSISPEVYTEILSRKGESLGTLQPRLMRLYIQGIGKLGMIRRNRKIIAVFEDVTAPVCSGCITCKEIGIIAM